MKTLKLLTATLLFMMTTMAYAQNGPAIDSLNVQAYMAQGGGTPVSDGTYTIAFAVCQNGAAIWGKEYSVTTSGGLFTEALSGVGTDLTGLPNSVNAAGCTGMRADFSGVGLNKTLNPALLIGDPAGEVSIRVYSVSVINTKNPQFDVAASAVPTAFVADTAYNLSPGALTLGMIAASATTTTSVGGAGKLPLLDGAGLVALNMIPNLPASQITSGTLGINRGGTGAGTAVGALGTLGAAASGANVDITGLNPTGTLAVGGAATTVINILPTGAAAAVDIASNGVGLLTVGGAGTGASKFGNTGAGSVTTVTGPTLDLGDATTTAVNVTPTGAAAAINIATNGIGLLTVGGAGSGNATFGNFGGGSETILQSGTGNIAVAGATQLILPASAFSITQGGGAVAPLTIATTNGQNLALSPNGAGVVSIGGSGLSGATGTFSGDLSVGTTAGSVKLGTVANGIVTISQSAGGAPWTMTLPISGGSPNFVLSTDGSGTTSWINPVTTTAAINPTGTLNVGGAATTVVDITPTGAAASIDIASNGAGTLVVGGAGSGAASFGNTGGTAATTIQSGTGGINITEGAGATVPLALSTTNGQNITMNPQGAGIVEFKGGNGIQLDGSLASSVVIVPQATAGGWTWILPNTVGSAGQMLTTNGVAVGQQWSFPTPLTTLGDIMFSSATVAGGSPARLAGNTTAAKQFLTQTGTGAVSAAPIWGAITSGDLPAIIGGAVTANMSFGATATTSATTIQSGSGGILIDPSSGNNVTIGNTGGGITQIQSPTVKLGGAASTTSISTTSTGLTTLNLGGSSTSPLATTLGGTNTTSGTTIQSGSNGIFLDPSSGNTVTIGNTGGGTTQLQSPSVKLGAAALTTSITTTSTGLTTLNLGGSSTSALATTLGGTNTTSTTTLQSGSGGIVIDPSSGNAVTIGNTGGGTTTLQSPTVNLGAAALTTTIATQSTGLTTLNLGGTSTAALTTTLGSPALASSTAIKSGTGGVAVTGAANAASAGTGGAIALTAGNETVAAAGGGATAGGITMTAGSITAATSAATPGAISLTAGSTTVNSGTGGAVTIAAGNDTGTTSTGGSVTINAGTGTTTNGTVNIGTSNTAGITFGAPITGGSLTLPAYAVQGRQWNANSTIAGITVTAPTFPTAPTVQGTGGPAVNSDNTIGAWLKIPTTAVADKHEGVMSVNANSMVQPQWNPTMNMLIATTGTNTDWGVGGGGGRFYWGFTSAIAITACGVGTCSSGASAGANSVACNLATNGAATNLGVKDAAMFRFATTTEGDTHFMCVTCKAAVGCTVADSGVTPNVTPSPSASLLTVSLTSASATFKINGVSVCGSPILTNTPTAATPVAAIGAACSKVATQTQWLWGSTNVSF